MYILKLHAVVYMRGFIIFLFSDYDFRIIYDSFNNCSSEFMSCNLLSLSLTTNTATLPPKLQDPP